MKRFCLISFFLPGILMLLAPVMATPASAGTARVRGSVLRGNIVRDSYNPSADAGCYLANGRFGAVYGGLGLNLSPEEQASTETGASHFSHIRHWGRFSFTSAIEKTESTADYLLPMFKLYWEQSPSAVTSYTQVQNFYDGTLTTSFKTEDGTDIKVIGWFDNVDKDLAGLKIHVSRDGIAVRTSTFTDFQAYPYVFRDKVFQETGFVRDGDNWKMSITCPQSLNGCSSDLYFFTDASAEACENGARIVLDKGWNEIFISYGKPVTPKDRKLSLKRSIESWHRTWGSSARMDFPDPDAQGLWVRSLAYLISSYDDFEPGLIQPTNGLSGNTFPFHFVQDLEYVAPALMMTGHNDIVMKWVEKFASEIEPMKAYAKHLWPEAEGIYPPWELPFGDIEGYHSPTIPVAFCREPHNPGYLCRLAVEAGEFAGDAEWTGKYVFPLVREVCNFYKAACHKEDDGLWHLGWYPSIGQDEAGGRDKTDYLCSLYSAEYSFRTAVSLGLDEDGSLAGILRDGLAFESLMSERGTLHTCKGADDFGIQKHPVQLDGLSYFPRTSPSEPERKAYSLRYGITDRAADPHFFGWTLGQFLLSGSNLGDASGWRRDWDNIRASNYTDPEWIQIYETSGNHNQSFYVTTHGMIEQSLIRNYVNDYWGTLDIAACPAFEGKVSFTDVDTRLGVRVSGAVDGNRFKVRLKALRDCSFTFMGQKMTMRKGKVRTFRSTPDSSM